MSEREARERRTLARNVQGRHTGSMPPWDSAAGDHGNHVAGQPMTTFEPQDLARLGRAFDAAVAIAADEASPFAVLPARVLRLEIARAILAGTHCGVRDADQLKAHALRMVAATLTALEHDAIAA